MERWQDIPSLPGYQASDTGRIRSVDRVVTDSRGRSYCVPGKLRRLNVAPNGYLRFNTSAGAHAVHRCVLEAFVGTCPDGHHGAHGDGNRAHNDLTNLRWASPVDNAADKALHGTTYRPIGIAHPGAKLTEEQVRQIKRLHARGILQRHIGLMTGVPYKTINSIVRGRSWSHIQLEQSDLRAMERVA